ncbi:cysteine desulfurase family protein [Natronoglycomyces albus]|uniref:Cysteine desulfurase n=1 Tax=Natronoglycomyces albus TaxID=2811108 RepID=A0A895XMG3_9ACTN|nr:cysteine desulfurase family protein [Natronoglycomyces albus]QSB06544.1 cysteine desulfurase [Natronoglycomyces albus]
MSYLDHAATTPMLPAALDTYLRVAKTVGNASSLHTSGRAARRIVEESREQIAAALGAKPSEVIFTGSGTEADNLATKGLFWSRRAQGRHRLVTSGIEHHAVADPITWLECHEEARVTRLNVDEHARIDVDQLADLLLHHREEVALISCMWANNEVGTVQPIAQIVELADDIPVHSDAVQAVGAVPVNFAEAGLTALTLSAHKLGGPVGVGALLLKRDASCTPILHGGGQEREVRSGTLDTAGIASFATAVATAVENLASESRRLEELRDDLIARVRQAVPTAILNGDPENRLPGNAHFSFPGCEGDALLMLLDAAGIECATGSACTAGVAQPSHVLLAMGVGEDQTRSSLRFSLGHTSTPEDVSALVKALPAAVERARSAGLS